MSKLRKKQKGRGGVGRTATGSNMKRWRGGGGGDDDWVGLDEGELEKRWEK